MCEPKKPEQPTVVPIKKIISEAKDFKTFILEYPLQSEPGQFILAWLPGLDAKPFAVSHQTETEFGFSVLAVGPFSTKMMDLKEGDKIGVFGPYGNKFDFSGQKIAMVGGGCGTPPLRFAALEAVTQGKEVDLIMGARTAESIAYEAELAATPVNVLVATDDGTKGTKGFTTDVLRARLAEKKYDLILTCGPEIMMQKVIEIADEFDIACQVSMERYMKCGFGVCGQCSVDGLGVPLCKQGPIFDKEKVRDIKEFAKYKRDAKGEKVYFNGQKVEEE